MIGYIYQVVNQNNWITTPIAAVFIALLIVFVVLIIILLLVKRGKVTISEKGMDTKLDVPDQPRGIKFYGNDNIYKIEGSILITEVSKEDWIRKVFINIDDTIMPYFISAKQVKDVLSYRTWWRGKEAIIEYKRDGWTEDFSRERALYEMKLMQAKEQERHLSKQMHVHMIEEIARQKMLKRAQTTGGYGSNDETTPAYLLPQQQNK